MPEQVVQTEWVFVGACRCAINNSTHAICTREKCPLHGSGVAPLHPSKVKVEVRVTQTYHDTDPWEI